MSEPDFVLLPGWRGLSCRVAPQSKDAHERLRRLGLSLEFYLLSWAAGALSVPLPELPKLLAVLAAEGWTFEDRRPAVSKQ